MSSIIDNKQQNKRVFPRISVSCPVLYLPAFGKRWRVAKLVNFSATGICMECDDLLDVGVEISVKIKPGSQKSVPELSATGVVMRCETNEAGQYEVSCKLTKVHR